MSAQQQPESEANLYKAIQLQTEIREALEAYDNGTHGNYEVKVLANAAERMLGLIELAKEGNRARHYGF